MAAEMDTIYRELHKLREDMDYIKSVVGEDFELSMHAKKALKEARKTSKSEYADLE